MGKIGKLGAAGVLVGALTAIDAMADSVDQDSVIGGLEVPSEFIENPEVQAAVVGYQARLESLGLFIEPIQSCDLTDPSYETLWDSCNTLDGAVLKARVSAKQERNEASQNQIETLDIDFETSQTEDERLAHLENTQAQKIETQAETIASQQALLAAFASLKKGM